MSLILQIETATSSCSVALANNGHVLAEKLINQRNIHAEIITLFIDELVKDAGIVYQDIDAVAVSSGPGSYTGLRIGVATAKGLCFALDKPLIAVETLQGMANGIRKRGNYITEGMLLCPMIDARRMEVFTAVFNNTGDRIEPTTAEIITEDSFSNLLKTNKVLFFGDGAEKCKAVLGENPNVYFMGDFVNSAADLTECAFTKFKERIFETIAYFEPYYLKEFIAGKKAKSKT
jgi:tRNA threonylcarbamoyladenosine biosynthesis protein TsaB